MKLTKKRGCKGTIRKVWSDNKEVCFGIIGTVGDLLKAEILEYCDCEPETWMYIPTAPNEPARFDTDKERILKWIKTQKEAST